MLISVVLYRTCAIGKNNEVCDLIMKDTVKSVRCYLFSNGNQLQRQSPDFPKRKEKEKNKFSSSRKVTGSETPSPHSESLVFTPSSDCNAAHPLRPLSLSLSLSIDHSVAVR